MHVIPRSVAVSAPLRVRERLRHAPDGARAVVHAGRHALYLDLDGWCLGVVGRAAAQVPCALRLGTDDLAALEGATAYVEAGTLHVDGAPLAVGRVVDTRVPRHDPAAGRPATTTPADVPTAVLDFVAEVGLVRSPGRALDPADATRLVGRGGGLTPLGDDVLCGWLALHRAAGRATLVMDAAVRSLLPRTTLLSATLLECAMAGEVIPEFAAWLAGTGPVEAVKRIGHTSGRGLVEGARRAMSGLERVAA